MQEHVYVIGSPESPLVKIGYSDDPDGRLRQIRTMSPVALQILWKTPGGRPLEKALHRYFYAAREHGEWFRLSDPVPAVQRALQDPRLYSLPPLPKKNRRPSLDLSGPNWGQSRPIRRSKPYQGVGSGWTQPQRISGKAVSVCEGVLERIESGEFPAGSPLPRIAVLAAEYGVPTITVTAALKHLVVRGLLVWPRHGQACVSSAPESLSR